ncbi:GntR family transcriptional regulator [Nonomuraea sp. NPDC023979]|uniref:GntR family transcriptional regulator n=1 Tax=Nonomuraea sp. NPDC023979 TaxID=3154796 RepID=UPI0033CEE232
MDTRNRGGTSQADRLLSHLRALAEEAEPGTALPSQAELSEQFGVTHVTVARAYAELRNEGLVVAVRYKGYYRRGISHLVMRRTRPVADSPDDVPEDAPEVPRQPHPDVLVDVATAARTIGSHTLADLLDVPSDTVLNMIQQTTYGADGHQVDALAISYQHRDHTSTEDWPTRYHETVLPRLANRAEMTQMQLPAPTAVLEVIRIGYHEDLPVNVQHIITTGRLDYQLAAPEVPYDAWG